MNVVYLYVVRRVYERVSEPWPCGGLTICTSLWPIGALLAVGPLKGPALYNIARQ
jgi:hypothetical protein